MSHADRLARSMAQSGETVRMRLRMRVLTSAMQFPSRSTVIATAERETSPSHSRLPCRALDPKSSILLETPSIYEETCLPVPLMGAFNAMYSSLPRKSKRESMRHAAQGNRPRSFPPAPRTMWPTPDTVQSCITLCGQAHTVPSTVIITLAPSPLRNP